MSSAGSPLAGRTCVVTGASSGIGRAIAVAMASMGATVHAVARRPDELLATVGLAKDAGRIMSHPLDLTVDGDIRAFAHELGQRGRGVDALVHSAGTFSLGPVAAASVEGLDLLYMTNVRAPYLLTQALLPMLEANGGQIVFINSSIVFSKKTDAGQFAVTQHALRALTDALRDELNPRGVRVASIYPGRTATPRQVEIHELEGKAYAPDRLLQPEDVAEVVVDVLTHPRTGEITDVRVRPMAKS